MRRQAFCSILLALTGCTTTVEHARLDLAEDLSSNLQVLLSGHYEPKGSDSEESREDRFKAHLRTAKACGASTRMFYEENSKDLFLQLNISAKTRDELQVIARCAAVGRTLPKLTITTDDRLLGRTVTTSFSMRGNLFDLMSRNYPREFTLTVPGKIKEVRNLSKMISYSVSESRPSENVFRFEVEPRAKDSFTKEEEANYKSIIRRICGNRDPKDCKPKEEELPEELRFSEISYTIVSEKPKYDLNAGLTLLGILFGSGVVFQAVSHFRRQ